jgi:hypothetical protein
MFTISNRSILTLSKLKSFLLYILIPLFITSCATPNIPTNYSVSFYDDDLNLNKTIELPANEEINIISLAKQLNFIAPLYTANSSTDITTDPNYETYKLINNINFYAIPNVKEIRNQIELNSIRYNLTGKYILINDITLNKNEAGFDAFGWRPIGGNSPKDFNSHFAGIFNGDSHKIDGLWIDGQDSDYIGLLSIINGAQIKNLGVKTTDKDIKGHDYVGVIVGLIYDGSIKNSYSIGNINGYRNVGGISGFIRNGLVKNSYFNGNLNGIQHVGGLSGWVDVDSLITNSYSNGNVSGELYIGGIAGYVLGGFVTNSYSTANINGSEYIGGIAGTVDNGLVKNSYAIGNIIGTEVGKYIGGIAGYANNSIVQSNAAINPSIIGNTEVNRIVGIIDNSAVLNNFATNALGLEFSDFSNGNGYSGVGKDDSDFLLKNTYENRSACLGWIFGNDDNKPWVWNAFESYSYPTFYWQTQKP